MSREAIERWRRWGGFAALEVPFIFVAAGFAYRHVFSWFLLHDDEGYVMMSVRQFLHGRRLYDDVPMPYGPAYYLYESLVHGALDLPLTHDVTRLETLVIWLACVLLVGVFVLVTTGSAALALPAQFAVLSSLILLANEPGHPQELVVLVLAMSLVFSLVRVRRPLLGGGLLGIAAAVVLFSKANLGVYAAVAIATALAADLRPTAALRAMRAGAIVVFVLLPWLLLALKHDWSGWAVRYAGVVSLSALPVGVALWTECAGQEGWRDLAALGAGFTLASIGFVLFALGHGSSAGALWECLWVMPQRLTSAATPPPIGSWTVAATAALIGIVLPRLRRYRPAIVCLALLEIGFAIVVLSPRIPFDFGSLIDYAAPWIWLSVVPAHDRSLGFPRAFVATGAVMILLWAYPVPGSQLALATFFLPVAATMAGADAVATVRQTFAWAVERRLVHALALAAVVLLVGHETIRLRRFATESYEASVPLALPGANRLRVEPTLAASLTSLVRTLRDAPDTFLATDGFNSLYLWTDKEPPSPILITHPIGLYDTDQQDALTSAMLSRPQALLVLNPSLPEFRGEYEKPFYQNLFRAFAPREHIGPFVVAARRAP